MPKTDNVLLMKGISKSFPGVKALDNVDLELSSGEILAILGENGAGKSTLLKILAGVYQKDSGSIFIDGEEVQFNSPLDSIREGISVIYQELSYVSDLTVAENIFLNRYPVTRLGKVDWKKLNSDAKKALESIDANVDPSALMSSLNVAEKQMVEIARAITGEMKILITDEPTSAITDHEITYLFNAFRKLQNRGVAIIFISHKLQEVKEISDNILVLRDGRRQGLYSCEQTEERDLISYMIGRPIKDLYPEKTHKAKDMILEVSNLKTRNIHSPISFDLREGEILGIFGLMGSGITEIGEVLFGLRVLEEGEIKIRGELIKFKRTEDYIKARIAYVPAERKSNGMIGGMSIAENMAIPDLILGKNILLNHERDQKRAQKWKERLSIRTPSIKTNISSLSGGNQQKVILSKWLDGNPKILILHEPTRGIDMGAKAEIYRIIETFCAEGGAVILISSELPEIVALSDKYMVLHEGILQKRIFSEKEIDGKEILALAMGIQ